MHVCIIQMGLKRARVSVTAISHGSANRVTPAGSAPRGLYSSKPRVQCRPEINKREKRTHAASKQKAFK